MKINKPKDVHYLVFLLLLMLAVLSSCTDDSNVISHRIEKYSYEGHQYIQMGRGSGLRTVHNPSCEKRDMIEILDSLQTIPK